MITPYSKITTVSMWTDDYISRNMLKYHIDPSTDAASRKLPTIKKTVDFISTIITKDKSICDFGCGPGLYTNLLEKEGYQVTGVDVSKNSLKYARENNSNVDYINMNYIDSKLDKRVDFAMMIYCDFGAMDPLSQSRFLKNLHSTLNDGGLFFFDVMSDSYFDSFEESYSETEEVDGFFMPGKSKVISKSVKYPKLKLTLRYQKATGIREFEVYNWDKSYTPIEMEILLKDHGFEIVDHFSNTTGEKDCENSETICFLVRKVTNEN